MDVIVVNVSPLFMVLLPWLKAASPNNVPPVPPFVLLVVMNVPAMVAVAMALKTAGLALLSTIAVPTDAPTH
jgi:hypothetical protein